MKKKLFVLVLIICFCSCRKKKPVIDQVPAKPDNNTITLSPREQDLINLRIDTAGMKIISESITLTGNATTDENKISAISTRVGGRIEKLFVRNPGAQIKTGEPLFSIYSEELLSAANEYLLILKRQSEQSISKKIVEELAQSSKNKLLLWGLSEATITELEKSLTGAHTITFYSNISGYVTELNISEGEYAEEGTVIFKIAQSGSVWVEARVYPYEIKYLTQNPEIEIMFDAFPQLTFPGKIVFVPPAFEKKSQIVYLRIVINNNKNLIRPGMIASVTIKYNEKKTLVIPSSAIIPGEMPVVWLETEPGNYEMTMVHAGIRTTMETEILHGIKEGDKIVSSGAYLINSEFILRKGASASHQH